MSILTRLPAHLAPLGNTELDALLRGIVNRANKYTLNTWLPDKYPGTGITTPVGPTEGNVRPLGAAALGLTSALAVGAHDEGITGFTAAQAQTQAVRLIRGSARSHVANGGIWGDVWQSPLWAFLTGTAAWLIWPNLTDGCRDDIARMVIHEADRMTGEPAYWRDRNGNDITPGDSKSEEVAWMLSVVALAVVMFPRDHRVADWTDCLCRWGVAAYAAPQDVTSQQVINGRPLSALGGYNVFADGDLMNHGKVNPDYITSGFASLWSCPGLFAAADALIPTAATHNLPLVYGALTRRVYPPTSSAYGFGQTIYIDGTDQLYYPAGDDWGSGMILDKALADVVSDRWGLGGPRAHEYAVRHLRRAAGMQARHSDGHTFAEGESTYPGREQWVSHHAGLALINVCAGPLVESNLPPTQLAALSSLRGEQIGDPVTYVPPFELASGIVTFPAASAAVHTYDVVFPVGRFTLPPHVVTSVVTASDAAYIESNVSQVTKDGMRVLMFNTKGEPMSSSGRRVHWTATQATETSATAA